MGKLMIGAILCGARGFFDSLARMVKFFAVGEAHNILYSYLYSISLSVAALEGFSCVNQCKKIVTIGNNITI